MTHCDRGIIYWEDGEIEDRGNYLPYNEVIMNNDNPLSADQVNQWFSNNDPLDNGDFASDDWLEGKAMEAEGLPQLED